MENMKKNKVDEYIKVALEVAYDEGLSMAEAIKVAYLSGAAAREERRQLINGTHDFGLYAKEFHESMDFLCTQPVGFDKDGELADLLEEMYHLGAAAQKEADLAASSKSRNPYKSGSDASIGFLSARRKIIFAIGQAEIGDKDVS